MEREGLDITGHCQLYHTGSKAHLARHLHLISVIVD